MEFIETPLFEKVSKALLSDQEIAQIQMALISYPAMGALIPGAGGLRKLRWVGGGKGKRGGLRIIYYWVTKDNQIYFLYVYKKNRQEDLTADQIKHLRTLLED